MLLGEWWVANPTDAADDYAPPDHAERVPGVLREVAQGEFVLETVGFLGDRPPMAGGPVSASGGPRFDIWGTDRDAKCYSLFDNLRTNSTWKSGHVSDGYEDWSIGWLAKGNVWVTPDEECGSARIRINDLHAWALLRQPDKVGFDDARKTATIDLRDETLGTRRIGETRVSLVRGPRTRFSLPGQDRHRQFSFVNEVYWKVEGPLMLRSVVKEWIGHFERFVRFMTMEPSVVSRVDCRFEDPGNWPVEVELIAPRLPRHDQATDPEGDQSYPHKYLTTLRTLEELGIDPMSVVADYWRAVVTGDAYMAMALHLESQDRLVSRGADSALLNAIRSVESLYAAQNPGVTGTVQEKIDDAVYRAADIGTQVLDAWPVLRKTGGLRRHVVHGKGRPSADFGLRCLGGAMALQWIQRFRLLTELGIDETSAHSIVSDNFQYARDLETLENWSTELGTRSVP